MISTKNIDSININTQLAEICGIHAGDGYLRNDGRRRELDISGGIEEKEYYDEHVIPLFKKFFGIGLEGRYFHHRSTYGFVIRNPKVIEFMHNLGFPYGNKSQIINAPIAILENLNLSKAFLRGYFDTDGHFSCSKKYGEKYTEFKKKFHHYPKIVFVTVSKDLSNSLKIILNKLGFKFYFHNYQPRIKTESLKYIFDLNGVDRVQKFFNLINPKNVIKKSRYDIWKKFGICPTNITYKQRQSILKGSLNPYIFYKGL